MWRRYHHAERASLHAWQWSQPRQFTALDGSYNPRHHRLDLPADDLTIVLSCHSRTRRSLKPAGQVRRLAPYNPARHLHQVHLAAVTEQIGSTIPKCLTQMSAAHTAKDNQCRRGCQPAASPARPNLPATELQAAQQLGQLDCRRACRYFD